MKKHVIVTNIEMIKKKNTIIILVYSEHEKTKEDERIALNNEGETEHSETVLK